MSRATILVADDDRAIRTVLNEALARIGYKVQATGSVATLWRWVSDGIGDLVITDVIMPDGNGLDMVTRIRASRPDLRVIVLSARNTLMTALRAADHGAFEYLPKPFDLGDLMGVVQRALTPSLTLATPTAPAEDGEDSALLLIGRSPPMQDIYRTIARLVGVDLTVMIFGESGTGKELAARALHDFGKRREGPFVAVNMAAIPRELIESELFGHERGAFTGATQRSIGRFEQAANGTLFLDEIGDMPLEAQTRLLRVLQQEEFTPVGGRIPIQANVRIVSATHRDLPSLIQQGQFREDLFYRLNVVPIKLPPLRERTDDIPLLIRHFLSCSVTSGSPRKHLDDAAIDSLCQYHWPGNVRELKNLIQRLVALYPQDVIGADIICQELAGLERATGVPEGTPLRTENLGQAIERHLKDYFSAHKDKMPSPGLYDRIVREIEKPLIHMCLLATNGNQVKAATILGLNRNTLRKKIKDLHIDFN